MEEALAAWLDQMEEAGDVAASAEGLAEYESAGGVDADAFFAHMINEGRVAYGSD